MPNQVSMGAMMACTMGAAPSSLVVLPKNKVLCEGPPAANIMDHIPMVNILPFGIYKYNYDFNYTAVPTGYLLRE